MIIALRYIVYSFLFNFCIMPTSVQGLLLALWLGIMLCNTQLPICLGLKKAGWLCECKCPTKYIVAPVPNWFEKCHRLWVLGFPFYCKLKKKSNKQQNYPICWQVESPFAILTIWKPKQPRLNARDSLELLSVGYTCRVYPTSKGGVGTWAIFLRKQPIGMSKVVWEIWTLNLEICF